MRLKLLLLLVLAAGCSYSSDHVTLLEIKSEENTNQGSPFYVLLKSSSLEEFLVDDDDKISTLIASPISAEGLKTFCVLPGKTKKIKITSHPDRASAIYFLFTQAEQR